MSSTFCMTPHPINFYPYPSVPPTFYFNSITYIPFSKSFAIYTQGQGPKKECRVTQWSGKRKWLWAIATPSSQHSMGHFSVVFVKTNILWAFYFLYGASTQNYKTVCIKWPMAPVFPNHCMFSSLLHHFFCSGVIAPVYFIYGRRGIHVLWTHSSIFFCIEYALYCLQNNLNFRF